MKMSEFLLIAILLVPLCSCVGQDGIAAGECSASPKMKHQLSLSIRRTLDASDGRWMSAFIAWREDPEESSGELLLDATHRKTECDGLTTVRVEAFIKEMEIGQDQKGDGFLSKNKDKNLIFHPRHGNNAVILENGRIAQKLNLEDVHNAVVFTHRPLKANELFEVRLEKRITKSNYCLGIGIMSHSPENVKILAEMYKHSNGTWIYHNNHIYHSGTSLVENYGHNINTLQVRERVGVMRRDDGELHFFVNGVDQGRAAANIPEKVYGVVELWNDAVKVKIIY